MASQYQLQGTVKFGSVSADTDVSADVFACTFRKTYDEIERPGTFASGRKTKVAGNFSEELVVSFANSGTHAASGALDALIQNAVWAATPSTTLYFEFRQFPEAVGATNPKITGTCSVLEAVKGGEVGSLRQTDITLPVLTSNMSDT